MTIFEFLIYTDTVVRMFLRIKATLWFCLYLYILLQFYLHKWFMAPAHAESHQRSYLYPFLILAERGLSTLESL